MKAPRLVQDYLLDIIDAMDKAEAFIGDMDLDVFGRDDKTAFAVIRSLEIIGEAAKKKVPHKMPHGLSKALAGVLQYTNRWYNICNVMVCIVHEQGGKAIQKTAKGRTRQHRRPYHGNSDQRPGAWQLAKLFKVVCERASLSRQKGPANLRCGLA